MDENKVEGKTRPFKVFTFRETSPAEASSPTTSLKKEAGVIDFPCESLPSFQRNNYFYGKLLTVDDFKEEQKYFVNKNRLINHLLHGSGVVCGLKVLYNNKDPDAQNLAASVLRIKEGLAIDCCGREIVVSQPFEIDLKNCLSTEKNGSVYIGIKYSYCGDKEVEKMLDGSSCEEGCEFSRIKESFNVELYWNLPDQCKKEDDICLKWNDYIKNPDEYDFHSELCSSILTQPVILASVDFNIDRENNNVSIINVDNLAHDDKKIKHRKRVYSNSLLFDLIECTRKKILDEDSSKIIKINWDHNSVITFSLLDLTNKDFLKKIENSLPDKLVLDFNKPLQITDLNNKTIEIHLKPYLNLKDEDGQEFEMIIPNFIQQLPIIITYKPENNELAQQIMISLPKSNQTILSETMLGTISLQLGQIKSVATSLSNFFGEVEGRLSLTLLILVMYLAIHYKRNVGIRIEVKVKGDFIRAKDNICLDGNHLRGELPSGDMRQGGFFESWFDLKFEYPSLDLQKQTTTRYYEIKPAEIASNLKIPEPVLKEILDEIEKNGDLKISKGTYYIPPLKVTPKIIVYSAASNLKEQADSITKDLNEKGYVTNIKTSEEFAGLNKNEIESSDVIVIKGSDADNVIKDLIATSEIDWNSTDEAIEYVKSPLAAPRIIVAGGKTAANLKSATKRLKEIF